MKSETQAADMVEGAVRQGTAPGEKQAIVHLNKAAAKAVTTGQLFLSVFEPVAFGCYTVSQSHFPDPKAPSVVTSAGSLVRRLRAVRGTAVRLFGDQSYPAEYFKDAHSTMDTLEPQIEQTMEAYNMPELPANIQWDIERRWVTYLQACKEDGQMTYSPLTLADLTTMVTSNPTALNPPLKVKTLIAKAIAVPSLGGPPPQPPPRPSPYQPAPPAAGPNRGPPVHHANQPTTLACDSNFFTHVIHRYGINLTRTDPTITCPRLDDGKQDCLKFALRGVCDENCPRADEPTQLEEEAPRPTNPSPGERPDTTVSSSSGRRVYPGSNRRGTPTPPCRIFGKGGGLHSPPAPTDEPIQQPTSPWTRLAR